MTVSTNPAGSRAGERSDPRPTNPWRNQPILPTSEEEAGLPFLFRTPTFAIYVAAIVGLVQLFLWRMAPASFDSGESEYFGFVSQATIEISILVLTLTPMLVTVFLAATTRNERGMAFLTSEPLYYRGLWRLFSPMIWAAITLFLVFVLDPVQTVLNNPAVSGVLGTVFVGFVFLQVFHIIHTATALRSQIADEGKDTAAELQRLVREGKGRFVPKTADDTPNS
jgi:hypothetical protein